jgi:hypothetical protein
MTASVHIRASPSPATGADDYISLGGRTGLIIAAAGVGSSVLNSRIFIDATNVQHLHQRIS